MGPTSPAALTLVLPDQQPHVIQTLLTQDILFWAVIKAKNPFSYKLLQLLGEGLLAFS